MGSSGWRNTPEEWRRRYGFLTIHLLPYWRPAHTHGIECTLSLTHAWAEAARRVRRKRFAPKDILIGETGWPSEGRQRETAVPSRINAAKFMRGFAALAEQHGWRYNLIEAFDQPWNAATTKARWAVIGVYSMPIAMTSRCWRVRFPICRSGNPGWRCPPRSRLPALLGQATRAFATRRAAVAGGGGTRRYLCGGSGCSLRPSSSAIPGEWTWTGLLALLNALVLAHAALTEVRAVAGARWLNGFEQRGGLVVGNGVRWRGGNAATGVRCALPGIPGLRHSATCVVLWRIRRCAVLRAEKTVLTAQLIAVESSLRTWYRKVCAMLRHGVGR